MLKIKQSLNQLIISNDGEVVTLPLDTLDNAKVVISTLSKAVQDCTAANAALQQSLVDDTETYSLTQHSLALFNDATKNIASAIANHAKKSLETSPAHLHGVQLKSSTAAIAAVYDEVGAMLLNATNQNDTITIAKSLMAKAAHIRRDVNLISEALDAPLENLKRIKAQKRLEKELVEKGIKIGSDRTKIALAGTMNSDVLDTAKAIVASRKVADLKRDRKAKAVAKALSV